MKNEKRIPNIKSRMGFSINRAAFLMSEQIAERFQSAGYSLSAQDFGILSLLWNFDGLTQSEIACQMLRDKTTITRRLDGLQKKALINRKQARYDRRAINVCLTAAGKKLEPILNQIVDDFHQEIHLDIPKIDWETTQRTLNSIIENTQRSTS